MQSNRWARHGKLNFPCLRCIYRRYGEVNPTWIKLNCVGSTSVNPTWMNCFAACQEARPPSSSSPLRERPVGPHCPTEHCGRVGDLRLCRSRRTGSMAACAPQTSEPLWLHSGTYNALWSQSRCEHRGPWRTILHFMRARSVKNQLYCDDRATNIKNQRARCTLDFGLRSSGRRPQRPKCIERPRSLFLKLCSLKEVDFSRIELS